TALGVDTHWETGRYDVIAVVGATGETADNGRDELAEGEDRRGRKARQDHDGDGAARLPNGGEAEGLAGPWRAAAGHNTPRPPRRDDAIGDVASPFRRAAGEQDHVALQGLPQHAQQRGGVVRDDAAGNRLATQLAYRVGQDGGIAIEDEAGPHRLPRCD